MTSEAALETVRGLISAIQTWQDGNEFLFKEPYYNSQRSINKELLADWLEKSELRKWELSKIGAKYIYEGKRGRFNTLAISNCHYPNTSFEIEVAESDAKGAMVRCVFHRDIYDETHLFYVKKVYEEWFVYKRAILDEGKYRTEFII